MPQAMRVQAGAGTEILHPWLNNRVPQEERGARGGGTQVPPTPPPCRLYSILGSEAWVILEARDSGLCMGPN